MGMLRITPAEFVVDDYVAPEGPGPQPTQPLKLVAAKRAPVVSQDARRGIGTWLMLLGVMVDAAIIACIPIVVVTDLRHTQGWKRLLALYTVVGVFMLLTTYRRGRLVPRPSEQVLTI